MKLILLIWIVPVAMAACIGWWLGRDAPDTIKAYGQQCGWVMLWSGAVIFLWIAVLLFSLSQSVAPWAVVIADTAYWSILSAMFWAPVGIISYTLNSLLRR